MFHHEEINTFPCSRQHYLEVVIDSILLPQFCFKLFISVKEAVLLPTKIFQSAINELLVVRFTDKSLFIDSVGSDFQILCPFSSPEDKTSPRKTVGGRALLHVCEMGPAIKRFGLKEGI